MVDTPVYNFTVPPPDDICWHGLKKRIGGCVSSETINMTLGYGVIRGGVKFKGGLIFSIIYGRVPPLLWFHLMKNVNTTRDFIYFMETQKLSRLNLIFFCDFHCFSGNLGPLFKVSSTNNFLFWYYCLFNIILLSLFHRNQNPVFKWYTVEHFCTFLFTVKHDSKKYFKVCVFYYTQTFM